MDFYFLRKKAFKLLSRSIREAYLNFSFNFLIYLIYQQIKKQIIPSKFFTIMSSQKHQQEQQQQQKWDESATALEMEIQSVQAIFPDAVDPVTNSHIAVHCGPNIQLNIHLLADYPNDLPFFELCGPALSGDVRKALLCGLEQICAENVGEPMLYPLIERAMEEFSDEREAAIAAEKMATNKGKRNIIKKGGGGSRSASMADDHGEEGEEYDENDLTGYPASFHFGQAIEDRKSVFQAHVAKLSSKDQIPELLAQLKAVGKVERARHNPYAWRLVHAINVNGAGADGGVREIEQHDCDDDGEDGSASKLLRLLMQMDVRGVLVVVSRWKGGNKIGPDRFRHICNAARDALVSGGFVISSNNKNPAPP